MMDLSSGRGQFTSAKKLTYMALFIYLFSLTWGWLKTKGGQRYPLESDFFNCHWKAQKAINDSRNIELERYKKWLYLENAEL